MAAKTKKPMTKAELIQTLTNNSNGMTKTQVKSIIENLASIGHKELKKNKVFKLPGFAKFSVQRKKATKARKGINRFTGEEIVFAAKPAHNTVRARPEKAIKDAVN